MNNPCLDCIDKNCPTCEIPTLDICKDCHFKQNYEKIMEMKKIIERMMIDIRSVM